MKIVAVVQARLASQRLPGKVLRKLGNKPALDWVVGAAKRATGVDEVIVATSTNKENDAIVDWCRDNYTTCFRGSEDDVLNRYVGVIESAKADAIVRLTGDCVFHDSRVIGEVIALYKASKVAYASNVEPPTWPDGLDTEVISAQALLTAASEATRHSDRDTVTRFIVRNRERFPAVNLTCPLNLVDERWVLDSPEDFMFMDACLGKLPFNWEPNWLELWDMLNANPQLRDINAKYARNERFFEGMATEKPVPRFYAASQLALERAERVIPFGAQTFSKSKYQFPAGNSPLYVSHGDGGYVYDVDGNDYVDLVGGLLPVILGHRDPDVDYAIRRQLDSGMCPSLATGLESDLAERLVGLIPCAEMVKFGKTGSDVTTAAVRMARAYTGKQHIVTHGYHGWHDWSMACTERNAGIPQDGLVKRVQTNDLQSLRSLIPDWQPAALVIEPEGWNAAHLREMRELCRKHGVVLVFDEVITGFRWSMGGYQKHVGVTPDMACFGKSMANGMPISAVVGRKDLMMTMCPPNNIFYSGTFFGETLSIAAAIATIDKMVRLNIIPKLWDSGTLLAHGVRTRVKAAGLDDVIKLRGDAPLIRLEFLGRGNVATAEMVKTLFIQHMTQAGVLIIASHNISYAHRNTEIMRVFKAYDYALEQIAAVLKAGDVAVDPIMANASVR